MSPVSLLLNLLWIVLGGAQMAFGWLVAAVIMAITIIGLPWARAAFNIAVYTFLPFGTAAVSRTTVTGREDIGTGPFGLIGLQNGDVISAINGLEMTSPDKALEVYTKLKSASHLSVGLERNGQKITKDYSIR